MAAQMIRVLLVDDQQLMREGMKTLLGLEDDIEVVGQASNGADALMLVDGMRGLMPDVVLMDIRMPVMNGVEATRKLRTDFPEVKVIILTTFDDDDLVFDALREGAKGYLTKDLPAEEIAQAIRQVNAGGAAMPPPIAAKVVDELSRRIQQNYRESDCDIQRLQELTDREQEVLSLLGRGYSNKELADALYITEGTAKNHVSSIIDKLGLRDRTQAALWAVRHGLVPEG